MNIVKILKYDNNTELSVSFEEAPTSSYIYYKCENCGEIGSRQKSRFIGEESDWLCKKCKTENTVYDKYGVLNISNIEGVHDKKLNTMKKNYGNTKQNIINGRKTLLEKYGVNNAQQLKEIREKSKETFFKNKFNKFKFNNFEDLEPLFKVEDYKGTFRDNKYPFKCKICGTEFESSINKGQHPRCPTCYPPTVYRSEEEIAKFLEQYTIVERNNKTILDGLEIDIYLPEYKIGIEHNGLYWHGEQQGKNKKYHLNKQILANEKGIQLIHVFENEWVYKSGIVKSVLLNKIGVYEKKIHGRKCETKEIDNITSKIFFNNNHIQGNVGASVKIGLFFENELVSVMTFGKSRFSKKYDWELVRFANKLNYKVYGAFTKLLKYFRNNYSGSIITYADKRYFTGQVYEKAGFTYLHDSQPNYFYFKEHSLLLNSRVKFQKHKLEKQLEYFNEELTEYENMLNNNYDRIWDCGNLVYYLS